MRQITVCLLCATVGISFITNTQAARSRDAFLRQFNSKGRQSGNDNNRRASTDRRQPDEDRNRGNNDRRENNGNNGGGKRHRKSERWERPTSSNTPGQTRRTEGGSKRGGSRPRYGERGERRKAFNDDIEQRNDCHRGGKYNKVRVLMAKYYQKGSKDAPQFDPIESSFKERSIPEDFNDGTELTVNADILEDFVGGDITPTVEQMEELVDEVGSGRKKRKVDRNVQRWTKSISYKWGVSDGTWQAYIRAGIAQWETNTCLNFVENGRSSDYITFIKGSGCYSNVGRTGGQQAISIGSGCEKIGIVTHEIGHALGFWHEQARPDRGGFIRIISGNILTGMDSQFTSQSAIDYYDGDYDMGSVMHYGPKAFTSDWSKRTIDTLDANYANTIGQRETLSFIDVKQINTLYCSDVCSSRSCQNGGYADPKSCSRCRCPSGLGGTDCTSVQTSDRNCGSTLTATTSWKTLDGPTVAANQNCNYKIDSPSGTRITIEVTRLNLPCIDTCSSFLEIKSKSNMEQTGARLCCDAPTLSITSEDNMALIMQRTDGVAQAGWRGWAIRYRYSGTPTTGGQVTTRQPTVTTTVRPTTGDWTDWGKWGSCSATCGMCGSQQRQRQCYSGRCRGDERQTRNCGQRVCGGEQKKSSGTCKGVIRAQCDMIRRLRLDGGGTVDQSVVKGAERVGGVQIIWDENDADNDNGDVDRCRDGRPGGCDRSSRGDSREQRRRPPPNNQRGGNGQRRGKRQSNRRNPGGQRTPQSFNNRGRGGRPQPPPPQRNQRQNGGNQRQSNGNQQRHNSGNRGDFNANRPGGNTGGGICNKTFSYPCNRIDGGGGGSEGTCCANFRPQGNGYCA